VITANDPIRALGRWKNHGFDLALVAYEMPMMSGATLVEELKFLVPDLPVLLLSGRKIARNLTWHLLRVVLAHTPRGMPPDTLRDVMHTRSEAATTSRATTSWSDYLIYGARRSTCLPIERTSVSKHENSALGPDTPPEFAGRDAAISTEPVRLSSR
jgi:CheY-like chemotaxis protein